MPIKTRLSVKVFTLLILFSLMPTPSGANEMEEGVQVFVSKQIIKKKAKYSFVVNNNSGFTINQVRIGSDYIHGVSELVTVPLNYKPAQKSLPSTVVSPKNWTASLVSTEEENNFEIRWSVKANKKGIVNKSNLSGFSTLLAVQDTSYESSHWAVVLQNGAIRYGTLQVR